MSGGDDSPLDTPGRIERFSPLPKNLWTQALTFLQQSGVTVVRYEIRWRETPVSRAGMLPRQVSLLEADVGVRNQYYSAAFLVTSYLQKGSKPRMWNLQSIEIMVQELSRLTPTAHDPEQLPKMSKAVVEAHGALTETVIVAAAMVGRRDDER